MSDLPKHIAIVMDGNRRWAKQKGLDPSAGHRRVVEYTAEALIEKCVEIGVPYLTLWAWSSENWKRSKLEVTGIMKLFRWALETQAKKLIKKGARIKVIGDLSKFPDDIRTGMEKLMEASKDNSKITVTYGLNYGGRDEIVRAVNDIDLSENHIVEEDISKHLDTAGMPDPDLWIRPGGEKRLSGFMIWQVAYAELYFSNLLMPDFGPEALDKAIEEYMQRQRRFGK